jgi:hypothetical protein
MYACEACEASGRPVLLGDLYSPLVVVGVVGSGRPVLLGPLLTTSGGRSGRKW